jgi:hypothetical protein
LTSQPSTVCSTYKYDLEYYRHELEGVNKLFNAFLASLILAIISIFVVLVAVASAGNAKAAIANAFYAMAFMEFVNVVIVVPMMYTGFRELSKANYDYSIGAKGAVVQGIGSILGGIVLIAMTNMFVNKIGPGTTIEEV